jgi:hypothetical protein
MPKPLNLIEINGVADENDYDHIDRLYPGRIRESHPAPMKGEKINPHVSRFELDTGEMVDVVHIKPIYYSDKDEQWRPMSEIAEEFGNHYIKLKPDWRSKVNRKYLKWIHKRMDLVNQGKSEELVLEKDTEGNPVKTVPRGLSEKVGAVFNRISDEALEAMWRNPNF